MFHQDSSKLVVYMSDQTHFSGPKANITILQTYIEHNIN